MKALLIPFVCLIVVATTGEGVQGQVRLGAEVAVANDFGVGVGGRVIVGLPEVSPNLSVQVGSTYHFPGEGAAELAGVDAEVDYWEFVGHARLSIPLQSRSVTPYVGAGISFGSVSGVVSVAETSVRRSTTETGLNLLGGAQFEGDAVTPFAEVRLAIGGSEQLVFAGGITVRLGN